MRAHLRNSAAKRFVVGAVNDPSALGALQALTEAGIARESAVIGHNAALEPRQAMRKPGSRMIGSVAFFPEKYGAAVIQLATNLAAGKRVSPAIFIKHQLVTPANVNRLYPNDGPVSLTACPQGSQS